MFVIFAIFISITACFAQPFPPDSVWMFSFDDGGDEFFYDAIEVSDGYLLCGEAREWNALAGEALLVKIDLNGDLVWAQRYPHERHRRLKRVRHTFLGTELFGEYVTESSQANGLFHTILNQNPDSLQGWEVGFSDGRPQQAASFGAFFSETWYFYYSSRNSDSTNVVVREQREFNGEVEREEYDSGEFDICEGLTGIHEGMMYFGRRNTQISNGDGFAIISVNGPFNQMTFGGPLLDFFNSATFRYVDTLGVLTGPSYSFSNGSSDLWIQAFNTITFDSAWSRHYGGLAYEDGVEILRTAYDGFTIAGNFSSGDIEFEQSDFWLLKVDDYGDSLWSVVEGGDEADRCEGMLEIETDLGFLLFGSSQSFAVPGWDGCAMLLAYVPDIAVASILNFGPVSVGDSATRVLGLTNTGSNVLTVSEIVGTENYSANVVLPLMVEVGETLLVEIVFTPQSLGTHVDTLRVFSDARTGVKTVRCIGAGTAADVDDLGLVPTEFKLFPPYPNPFNPTAKIAFDVARNADVELTIFDVQGRVVETLLNENLSAGQHWREWTCSTCAGGVYFARLRTSEFEGIQKLVLIK